MKLNSFLIALLVLTLTTGCAVLDKDKRIITEYLEDNITPKTKAGKIALAPVAIPVGFTTMVVDGFIVNPVRNAPKAFDDASYVFTDVEYTGPGEIFVFPMRMITFPLIFLGSELIRCTMDF